MKDPPPEDQVPEPGDTVITLNADGVPIIYTEPSKKEKGVKRVVSRKL